MKSSNLDTPIAPVSNFYETSLERLLATGKKPTYPVGAYCLFSAQRRKQIVKKTPNLKQKKIISKIQREWKEFPDKDIFQEVAKRDYKDYRRLLDIWHQMKGGSDEKGQTPLAQRRAEQAGQKSATPHKNCPPNNNSSLALVTPVQPMEPLSKRECPELKVEANGPKSSNSPRPMNSSSFCQGPRAEQEQATGYQVLGESQFKAAGQLLDDDDWDSSRSIWTSSDEIDENQIQALPTQLQEDDFEQPVVSSLSISSVPTPEDRPAEDKEEGTASGRPLPDKIIVTFDQPKKRYQISLQWDSPIQDLNTAETLEDGGSKNLFKLPSDVDLALLGICD